jgi:isopentenyl diphosphate isomerase/L-lactate dehydrogenase-like FMN-dependent dehydrogenase
MAIAQLGVDFDGIESQTPLWGNALRWDDLNCPGALTRPPLLLKGIQYGDDVHRVKDDGVEGMSVLFDSGVRSGSDVTEALAA